VNQELSTTVDAATDDAAVIEPRAGNQELETLLATLSSGFEVPPEGGNAPSAGTESGWCIVAANRRAIESGASWWSARQPAGDR
jgi:hypothetical protein